MEQKPFYIGQSLSWAWDTFKTNVGFLILVFLILWVVGAIFDIPIYFWRSSVPPLILNGVSLLVGTFLSIAVLKICLRFLDGGGSDFTDLYTGYPYFLNMIIGFILYGLLIVAGLILLIVPGIYWATKYMLVGYLIVDQDMSPTDAFKKSGQMTQGSKWHLLLFVVASLGINILGVIACGIGLFITMPLTALASAHIYRSLADFSKSSQPAVQPPPLQTVPPATGP